MSKQNFTINWNIDHVRSKKVVLGGGFQKINKDYWATFWPLAEDYFSPFSAFFASMGFEKIEIQKRQSWLLRDGLIPLLWFLNEHTPSTFGSEILLPCEFVSFIPDKWKSKASFYHYESIHRDKRNNVIVFLNSHPLLISEEEFETQVEFLKQRMKSLKINGEILFCARPVGPDTHGFDKMSYGMHQAVDFTRKFGSKVKYIDWQAVTQSLNCKNFYFFEINNKLIIADTFPAQYMLSKGAIDLKNEFTSLTADLRVPLSLHHQINLYDQGTIKNEKLNLRLNQQKLFYKKLVSLSYKWEQSVPWPLDINNMLRTLIMHGKNKDVKKRSKQVRS